MSRKLPNGLTVRQDDFARNVAKGMTETEAAIRAGYSAKTARGNVNRLMAIDGVRALIDQLRAKVSAKCEVDLAFVIGGLRDNALRCQAVVPVFDSDGRELGEYKFDSSGSNRALELLGKHLGAFVDRTQIELGDSTRQHIERIVQIIMDEVDPDTAQRIINRISGETGGGRAIG